MNRYIRQLGESIRKGDWILLLLCLSATAFGCLFISSATGYMGSARYIIMQIAAAAIGVLLYTLTSSVDAEFWAEHRTALIAFNMGLLLLLIPLMLTALVACSEKTPSVIPSSPTSGQNTTEPTSEATQPEDTTADTAEELFFFQYEGVKLIPGADFDPTVLPEADSIFEVPSCAIEGTDNVYSYPPFELTAYNDGTGEVIYSIFFIDPNITTDEGLALGDDVAKVIELYGEDYIAEGTAYIYTGANTILSILVQNDTVTSIEFRMEV